MQNKLTNTSRQVWRERVDTGSPQSDIIIPKHTHKQTPSVCSDTSTIMCGHRDMQMCVWEADEGSFLSLGSQGAVMYKACVDIV